MSLGLHFVNTFNLQESSRKWSQVHQNVLKSHRFYRFLRQRNVYKLNFISFNECWPTDT